MENQTKNMLILALSTLPGKKENDNNADIVLNQTLYECPDGEQPVVGAYQLEPVPKYLMRKFGLDSILLIETSATVNDCRPITVKDSGDVIFRTPKPQSAEEYFCNVISKAENLGRTDPVTVKKYLLQNGDIAAQSDIDNIILLIQQYAKEKQNVRIFLDLHGGPRSNVQMMTILFSLLPMETLSGESREAVINADDIYTVIYAPGNVSNNRIIHAGESFQLMDLAAGVHEFVEYGRTESLMRYANEHLSPVGCVKDMIQAMDGISDALAIGNITNFENALHDLKSSIKTLEEEEAATSNSSQNPVRASGILLRLVKQEYSPVIKDGADLLDRILWCKNKHFYQQVLTLCESRIPWYLHQKGILDMSCAIKSGCVFLRQSSAEMREFANVTSAFNAFISGCCSHSVYEEGRKKRYYIKALKRGGRKVCLYLTCDERNHMDQVDLFLHQHITMKQMRNYSNHALDESQVITSAEAFDDSAKFVSIQADKIFNTKSDLDKAISEYVQLVQALIRDQVKLKVYFIKENATYQGSICHYVSEDIFHEMQAKIREL